MLRGQGKGKIGRSKTRWKDAWNESGRGDGHGEMEKKTIPVTPHDEKSQGKEEYYTIIYGPISPFV